MDREQIEAAIRAAANQAVALYGTNAARQMLLTVKEEIEARQWKGSR
jgi:hypothetical protein